jgi:hypothetical protein
MWAAWQTWQAASFCPFACEWFNACATKSNDKIARQTADTLTI